MRTISHSKHTKLKNTKIYSKGILVNHTKISTNENFPLYGRHRLQPQSYLHATYSGGSICESGLSVHDSHRAITMLLILVEVSVKVACRSTTATDCGHRAITMPLILVEVSVKLSCRSGHRAINKIFPVLLFCWFNSCDHVAIISHLLGHTVSPHTNVSIKVKQ